ncbi:prepilin peptidase [Clostridia bacterium]|nr:prepilin peptidase [Clostridia bacterium]
MFVFYFIYGIIIGSFLNVCIYRLPIGLNLAYPRSHCPRCQHSLNGLDLVPLFSYLFIGGKCRYCGESISIRYFLVELFTGIGFLAVGLTQPFPYSILYLLWISFFIVAVLIQFDNHVPSKTLGVIGLIFSLSTLYQQSFSQLGMALLGGVLGFLISQISTEKRELGYVFTFIATGIFYGSLRFLGLYLISLIAFEMARLAFKDEQGLTRASQVRYLVFLFGGLILAVI